nr:hypothetical protein [Lachnospiraceae bacterium]
VEEKVGNYMVFFPSYQFLSDVLEHLVDRFESYEMGEVSSELEGDLEKGEEVSNSSKGASLNKSEGVANASKRTSYRRGYASKLMKYVSEDTEIIVQQRDMTEAKKQQFLKEFESNDSGSKGITRIGMCVIGGVFSEGIDLTGDRLIGVIIVGTGLPMVCTENEIYKDYFDKKKNQGFQYAYTYPGMNKVTQAGGRLIRTSTDTGFILLLDSRFLNREYDNLFPQEWLPYTIVNKGNVGKAVKEFWDGIEGDE